MSITHCKVKFLQDKSVHIVQIKSILEFKENSPKHLEDFEKNTIYNCLWNDDKNTDVTLPVQICELAEIHSEEDMKNLLNRRGKFSVLNQTVIDEYYEDTTDDDEDNDHAKAMEINKAHDDCEVKKRKKAQKKDIAKADKDIQKEILKQKVDDLAKNNLNIRENMKVQKSSNNQELCIESVAIMNEELIDSLRNEIEVWKSKFADSSSEIQKLKNKIEELEIKCHMYKHLNEQLNIQLYNHKLENINEGTDPAASRMNTNDYLDVQYNLFQQHSFTCTPRKCQQTEKSSYIKQVCTPKKCQQPEKSSDMKQYEVKNDDLHADISDFPTPEKQKQMETPTDVKKDCDNGSQALQGSDEEFSPSLLGTKKRKFNRIRDYSSSEELQEINENDDKRKHCTIPKKKLFPSSKTGSKTDDELETNNVDDEMAKRYAKKPEEAKDKNAKQKDKNNKDEESNEMKKISNMFSKFGEEEEIESDDGKVLMVYLNNEFMIPLQDWKKYKKLNEKLFTKKIFREMYKYPEEMSTRCVVESEKLKTPKGTRKRKAISPLKKATLQRCLKFYHLRKGVKGQNLQDKVDEINKYLTEDINSAIKKMKNM